MVTKYQRLINDISFTDLHKKPQHFLFLVLYITGEFLKKSFHFFWPFILNEFLHFRSTENLCL